MLRDKYSYLKRTLATVLERENADAIIAMSPENVLHLAGVYIASQRMIRERLAIAVYPRNANPFLVVSNVVGATASRDSWIEDVVTWAEHDQSPVEALCAELKRRGVDQGRVLLEMRYLAAAYFLELCDRIPNVEWVDAELLLEQSRMIKTPDEVELMRRTAIAAERAIWAGYMFASVGTTERQIQHRMVSSIIDLGADNSPFMSLAAGRQHTLETHAVPGDKTLEPGDIVTTDMVGTFKGYYSDLARMAIVGQPSPEQRRAWEQVVDVQRQVIDDARPGIQARELYQCAVNHAKQAGFELGTNLVGHSLGIALHEWPHLNPYCEEELQPGMTLCIEILGFFPDLGRFHVEDLIAVQDGSAARLTTYFDTNQMYEIPV